MNSIEINQEPVELYKLLKFEGLAASGGEAKCRVAEGSVRVNNEVETRKRRKIKSGDIIQFAGIEYHIKIVLVPTCGRQDK